MSNKFTIDNFVTAVRTLGVSKPNRFSVEIHLPTSLQQYAPNQEIISLYCENTNLPGQTIGVKQQRIYGPAYQRPFSVDYGGEGITMNFLIDGRMNIKAMLDAWVTRVVDPIQYFVHYPAYYTTKIVINQLNEEDEVVYSVELEDAFPRSVGMLDLNQSAQNQVHKLPVTFAYRRWIPIHSISSSIQYPKLDSNKPTPIEKKVGIGAMNTQRALAKLYDAKKR